MAVSNPVDAGLHLLTIGVLFALSLKFDVGPLAVAALVIAGIDLRIEAIGQGFSDVSVVVQAAIQQFLAGGNPYGIGYAVSNPPGAPFAYGPLALLWYMPTEPRIIEMSVSFLILGLLALRGRPMGLAIYATMPILVGLVSDGSNDTSAGLLLLAGLVVMDRLPRAGAFVLGLAVAFKPYALAWAPPMAVWLGASTLLPLLVGAGIFWLPALLVWGPGSILRSFQLADAIHTGPYWSLGRILDRFGGASPGFLGMFRFVAGGLTALAVLPFARSHRAVVVGGTLIFLATLFSGYWSTFAYLAAIAPVCCWYLDDWLGPSETRIAWPADPYGRLTAAIDSRWPPRELVGRTAGPGRPEAAGA